MKPFIFTETANFPIYYQNHKLVLMILAWH